MVQNVKRAAGITLRQVLHTTYDALDRRQRTLPALVPPRQINPNIGFTPRRGDYAREFTGSGDRVVAMLKSHGELKPEDHVLDIGSGIGRIARGLTTYLSADGEYRGFDVDPRAVAWCQRAYRGFSNFSFAYVPVGYVNVKARGSIRGEDLVFPYPDATFDLAFSMSVYTHLNRATVDHYLAETARVLRPGGVSVNTFFVIDDFAAGAMQSGTADRRYVRQASGVYVADLENPNFGIGFTADLITTMHESHDLTIVPPIRFGDWSGRTVECFVYQDVVVARKTVKTTKSKEPEAPVEERR
jgi:SAM-dependent methyltransferase